MVRVDLRDGRPRTRAGTVVRGYLGAGRYVEGQSLDTVGDRHSEA